MNRKTMNLLLALATLTLSASTLAFAEETQIEGTYLNTDGECTPRGRFNSFMVLAHLNRASAFEAQACSEARMQYFRTSSNWNVTFTVVNESYEGPFLAESTPDGSVRCRQGYVVGYEIQHCSLTVKSQEN
ncbi:MAG: hypothetical protein NDJ90_09965 [Oligoflexia bacterium]|nr:hypothetical protein [Oligoflexia bacterium]